MGSSTPSDSIYVRQEGKVVPACLQEPICVILQLSGHWGAYFQKREKKKNYQQIRPSKKCLTGIKSVVIRGYSTSYFTSSVGLIIARVFILHFSLFKQLNKSDHLRYHYKYDIILWENNIIGKFTITYIFYKLR